MDVPSYVPPLLMDAGKVVKPGGTTSTTETPVASTNPVTLLLKTATVKVTVLPGEAVVGATDFVNSRSHTPRKLTVISSELIGQIPLVTVHLNTYVPTVVPATDVEGSFTSIKFTVVGPDTCVHVPVPAEAGTAANVTDEN